MAPCYWHIRYKGQNIPRDRRTAYEIGAGEEDWPVCYEIDFFNFYAIVPCDYWPMRGRTLNIRR